MKHLFSFLLVILFISCKNDKKGVTISAEDLPFVPVLDERLPPPCELISAESIAKIVGSDKSSIEVKDATESKNQFSRACFYKWEDTGVNNAGVMIQVMVNPVAEEAPDYLTLYIDTKKTEGEQSFDSDSKHYYKDFSGFGDDGAYSHELSKYMWRIGNELSFLLAFNAVLDEKEELAAAKILAAEVMQKFN